VKACNRIKMEVSVQFHIMATLYLGKQPRYQLDRKMSSNQRQYKVMVKRTNLHWLGTEFLQIEFPI
jgi:hypothetical protein